MLRTAAIALTAFMALSASACMQGGHFSVLGYTTQPNYNTEIHTVRVPIFKNLTFRQGLEFDLTKEVIRQIEQKTPFKVVGANEPADTELLGSIVAANKNVINRNQVNEIREAETTLVLKVTWRDIATGEVLSKQRPADAGVPVTVPPLPAPGVPGQPSAIPLQAEAPPPPPGAPPTTDIVSLATFIPEVGESITTAYKKNVQRLATQVVSMMEKPW